MRTHFQLAFSPPAVPMHPESAKKITSCSRAQSYTPAAYPRHSRDPPLRMDIEIDYDSDPYFDKYGGYDTFRVWASCCEDVLPYINQQEFLPESKLTQLLPLLETASEEEIENLVEYEKEVKDVKERTFAAREGKTLPLPGQRHQWFDKMLMDRYSGGKV